MKYIKINGKKEKIPPFPHHKDYIYKCKNFFEAKNIFDHLFRENFYTLRELYRSFKFKCAIPRVLLIDPTSNCNLKCKGCWSNDYKKGNNISFEKLDDILTQAEKLKIRACFMTGGEPLLRKNDIIKLAKKHNKLTFGIYTNGTLIDKNFVKKMVELGNLNVFLSIEGTEEETDFRRGKGTYKKVIKAMKLLKENNIGFGFSACYHNKNYKTIASDVFLDYMRESGAWFGWLFNYIPIGKKADISLVCSEKERAYVQRKVSTYSKEKDYLLIDFWNNGHLAGGCVGAGFGFAHINSNGDVEPCAFCHYSDSNIYDKSLEECLKSNFFTTFRKYQPFNKNPLKSCPMIDNPDSIVKIVKEGKAKSTHLSDPESAEFLAAKCKETSLKWSNIADELYEELPLKNRRNWSKFKRYFAFRKKITDGRRNL